MIDISEEGTKLGEAHWSYIEKVLRIHGEDEKVIEKIKFHYIQAMKHGYKHGRVDNVMDRREVTLAGRSDRNSYAVAYRTGVKLNCLPSVHRPLSFKSQGDKKHEKEMS